MGAVTIKNLSFRYPKNREFALNDINFELNEGELAVICGESGSGKSTLLSLIKPELAPNGSKRGTIEIFGVNVNQISTRDSARQIAFVQQNPEYQAVTHSVRSELAFAAESVGMKANEIDAAVAECAAYFSFSSMLDERVSELSGGQKQLLNLAAACTLRPKVLILDEPFAQLDPLMSFRLLEIIKQLRDEFSITILLSEHRLQNIIPIADRVISINHGQITFNGAPDELACIDEKDNAFLFACLPGQMQFFHRIGSLPLPLTVAQGRKMLQNLLSEPKVKALPMPDLKNSENAIEIRHLSFSYGGPYVLNDLKLNVKKGNIFALMGENGSGKSTLLKLIAGALKTRRGKIKLSSSSVSYLPQHTEAMFAGPTIFDDLSFAYSCAGRTEEEAKEAANVFDLTGIMLSHPFDVSPGQMQKAAITMLLAKRPEILLLDEPTKGLDPLCKAELGNLLRRLCKTGMTVLMVCHDAEFAAEYADDAALMFDGRIVSNGKVNEFFSQSKFYTTVAHKLSCGIFENAVTVNQVLELWQKNN